MQEITAFSRQPPSPELSYHTRQVTYNEATMEYKHGAHSAVVDTTKLLKVLFDVDSKIVRYPGGGISASGCEVDHVVRWYVNGAKSAVPNSWVSTNKTKAYWNVARYYLDHLPERQVWLSEQPLVWVFQLDMEMVSYGFTPHLLLACGQESQITLLRLVQLYTSTNNAKQGNNKPNSKEVTTGGGGRVGEFRGVGCKCREASKVAREFEHNDKKNNNNNSNNHSSHLHRKSKFKTAA
jgi:hypothetical protein